MSTRLFSPNLRRIVPDDLRSDRRRRAETLSRAAPRGSGELRCFRLSFVHCALWVACCLTLAAPVQAQIYTWRDANGHLVLSNRPADGVNRTYVVPRAETVRATRPVSSSLSGPYDSLIA